MRQVEQRVGHRHLARREVAGASLERGQHRCVGGGHFLPVRVQEPYRRLQVIPNGVNHGDFQRNAQPPAGRQGLHRQAGGSERDRAKVHCRAGEKGRRQRAADCVSGGGHALDAHGVLGGGAAMADQAAQHAAPVAALGVPGVDLGADGLAGWQMAVDQAGSLGGIRAIRQGDDLRLKPKPLLIVEQLVARGIRPRQHQIIGAERLLVVGDHLAGLIVLVSRIGAAGQDQPGDGDQQRGCRTQDSTGATPPGQTCQPCTGRNQEQRSDHHAVAGVVADAQHAQGGDQHDRERQNHAPQQPPGRRPQACQASR